jgi:hypothetical protein
LALPVVARAESIEISIAGSDPHAEAEPLSITVSGAADGSHRLFLYVVNTEGAPGSSLAEGFLCAKFPSSASGTGRSLSGSLGESLSAGSYTKTYTYVPGTPFEGGSAYKLCGYLDESGTGTPDATASASFTVVSPKQKAEEEKYLAERAAQVKAAEEKRAKEKYEAEAPARAAAELAAAKARARSQPVTRLSVKAVAHYGRTSSYPGYTDLYLTTSHYAYVTVKLTRYGHATERFEWGDTSTEVAETIPWTCKSPGSTYRYVVAATTRVGPARTVRGQFKPVSVARCDTLKRHEAETRERGELRAAVERRRAEHEERGRLERFEANCRAEGGTPVTLYTETRAERGCKASSGGLLPVPV